MNREEEVEDNLRKVRTEVKKKERQGGPREEAEEARID